MSAFWFLIVIELIFGQDILKHDDFIDRDLSHVLDSTFDELNKISTMDISDLSIIEQHALIITKSLNQQQINVKLAISKLRTNYFWKQMSEEDQFKILGFYDVIQQSMSSLTSLSERTYNFYSKQMVENDGFISNTDEMIMVVEDIRKYHSVDELLDIIDIISNFKDSINNARNIVTTLIDDYAKFMIETQSYIIEQQLQIPQGFLDKYKQNVLVAAVDGFSTTQNVIFWTMSIAAIATSTTTIWPIFVVTELGLLLQYERSDKKKELEKELINAYDDIDDNIRLSFSALDTCIDIMSNAQKELINIDNGLDKLIQQIKEISRTSNELILDLEDGTTRKLLRKLKALKRSFERRQKHIFKQNKQDKILYL